MPEAPQFKWEFDGANCAVEKGYHVVALFRGHARRSGKTCHVFQRNAAVSVHDAAVGAWLGMVQSVCICCRSAAEFSKIHPRFYVSSFPK